MTFSLNNPQQSNTAFSKEENPICSNRSASVPYIFILQGSECIKSLNYDAIRLLIGCSKNDISTLHSKESESSTDWIYVLQKNMLQILEDISIDFVVLIDSRNGSPILEKYFPLKNLIEKGSKLNADFLLGNATGINMPVRVSRNLFWIESFVHSEFIIVFRNSFSSFINWLNTTDQENWTTFFNKAKNKFLLYPYIYFTNNNNGMPTAPYTSEMKRLSVINNILDKFDYKKGK